MANLPDNPRCKTFADYIVDTYIAPEAKFPTTFWTSVLTENYKRTNNGPESYHAHCNATYPSIYIFIDVMLKLQAVTDVKIRALNNPTKQVKNYIEKKSVSAWAIQQVRQRTTYKGRICKINWI